ncbi:hypothetical protein AT746_04370 [Lacimicrobium alkaliphilum]|uniref:Uncharacterized protein n=1 Tax=Lacimicrobium alkaliphilum TaxID=1526571 RepID=A0A0U2RJY3_9ALTE|nr:hypothetical protein AT746_04370 [Lacimicrobium alkaliphilum]
MYVLFLASIKNTFYIGHIKYVDYLLIKITYTLKPTWCDLACIVVDMGLVDESPIVETGMTIASIRNDKE